MISRRDRQAPHHEAGRRARPSGCFGAELFGIADILAMANTLSVTVRPGTGSPFQTRIVAVRDGRVPLAGATTVEAGHADRGAGPAALI